MIIFENEQRSLFGEILDWMLTPLLLIWPISLVITWLVAQQTAERPFDRALISHTQVLSRLVSVQGDRVSVNFPGSAQQILRATDDLVYVQVLGLRGELLSGERELALPDDKLPRKLGEVQIRDDELAGEAIRVAWLYLDVSSLTTAQRLHGVTEPILIQVAETRDKRKVLATEIVKGVLIPQFVALPLMVFLAWLALVRGTRPVRDLERRIKARQHSDLSKIDTRTVPVEMAPLVESVNNLFERERQSISLQRRFLADAAHQLKTPLAGLRMQADLALRAQASEAELKQSLQQISRASVNATRTVNQLLALARAENSGKSLPMHTTDLAALVQEMVLEALPRAMERHFDLGYEGLQPGDSCATVQAHPGLLMELVRNLIDNALSYVPSNPTRPGVITARVSHSRAERQVHLQVEDNGPGIPLAERDLVLQPFYRPLGQQAEGSGLGLAIVVEIANRHGAQLRMQPAHVQSQMPGLSITVCFSQAEPASPAPAETVRDAP